MGLQCDAMAVKFQRTIIGPKNFEFFLFIQKWIQLLGKSVLSTFKNLPQIESKLDKLTRFGSITVEDGTQSIVKRTLAYKNELCEFFLCTRKIIIRSFCGPRNRQGICGSK